MLVGRLSIPYFSHSHQRTDAAQMIRESKLIRRNKRAVLCRNDAAFHQDTTKETITIYEVSDIVRSLRSARNWNRLLP